MDKKKFQNLSKLEKEKLILEFLEKNKNKVVYPNDIAIYYNWDWFETFKICEKMMAKKQLI